VFRRLPSGLWIVLGLALLLRVGWGLTRSSSNAAIDALPDQREYLSIARSILGGRGAQFFDERFKQTVYAYRMPGYSWLIAACGCDPRVVRGLQALLDTSTVLAVFLLARRVLEPREANDGLGGLAAAPQGRASENVSLHCAMMHQDLPLESRPFGAAAKRVLEPLRSRQMSPPLLAALLVATNPFLIYFSGLLLSETLFAAMLVWGMLLLLSSARRRMLWILGAILLAISIYVRPSALLLPVILAFASALAGARRLGSGSPSPSTPGEGAREGALVARRRIHGNIKPAVYRAALAGVLIVAALFPWARRNSQPSVLGCWIWTTTNGGITAYDGWNPIADGGSNQAFLRNMPELSGMGEIQRSDYLAGRAREFVMHHPLRAVKLAFVKLARLWSPMPLSEQYSSPAYRAVGLLYCVPFDLLVLAGLIRGKLTPAAKVFLLLPAIYLTVVHVASVGSLRYLLPAIPPMGVLAGSLFSRPRFGRRG